MFLHTDVGDGLGAGRKLAGQAKKMTKKVCDLPGACG
ncbi:hypothetical protein FHR33_008627 [Nonomuraea dietziae]|uniref:Uncharacterized protein n=1 Tax=Nonomuraea dietziae TaxID=65515 RepID=A0A7W5VQY0_9ACTN|nr:hypothetical protein [Nonomuraea dietziae]